MIVLGQVQLYGSSTHLTREQWCPGPVFQPGPVIRVPAAPELARELAARLE
jgi:hypothetical protein